MLKFTNRATGCRKDTKINSIKNKCSGSTRDNPMKSCSILISIGASFWAAAPSGGTLIIEQLSKTMTEMLHRSILFLELLHTGKMSYVSKL